MIRGYEGCRYRFYSSIGRPIWDLVSGSTHLLFLTNYYEVKDPVEQCIEVH